jgi:hypothetical protein
MVVISPHQLKPFMHEDRGMEMNLLINVCCMQYGHSYRTN